MLEAFTLAGAIVAFANAVFTVWDRLLRGRPLAWSDVTVRTGGTPHDPCIHIQNPGPESLLIQSVRGDPPDIYGVAKDHSERATIEGATGKGDVDILLRPGEKHDLPIIDFPNAANVRKGAPQRVRFLIYWRKTSSTRLPQVPVVIRISTDAIQRIRAATVPKTGVS